MLGFNGVRGVGFFLAAAVIAAPMAGCKKAPNGRSGKRTVKAAIAEFDPEADVVLDLDKYGGERVDEWAVQQAFNRSFDGLDKCVADAKGKLGVKAGGQLDGDVDFAVKLNPKSGKPFAVNAKLTSGKLEKNASLKTCMREAVAGVGFPTYDGPPQVAEFSTQVDPGTEEQDW